jgi:serine/threonine protein kinase
MTDSEPTIPPPQRPAGTPVRPAARDGAANGKTPIRGEAGCGGAPAGQIPPELLNQDRYRVVEVVEVGGMGTVFKAEHLLMKRPVALKVINPTFVQNAQMRERFYKEIQAAARLAHPHIVTAFDADHVGECYFLVMEYVEGTNLNQIVSQQGPLSVHDACAYIRQAALGLQHAYECGILHRDIKPHNLMRTCGGCIKILDFGLARFISETVAMDCDFELTPLSFDVAEIEAELGLVDEPLPSVPKTIPFSKRLTYRGLGTPDYIAPETALDARRADVRTDIYSLGCTFYFLLTGQVPFPGGTVVEKLRCHFFRMPTPICNLRPEVPVHVAQVVERMMAKDPGQRFQVPVEVADALTAFARPPQGRVLLVEDDPVTREAMIISLETQGLTATWAANGREALVKLRAGERPDLILLDLMMPVMDGWEFLCKHQADPALSGVPIVIVSAADRNVARAAVQGAVDYLRKPVDPNELAAKVKQHLTRG